MRRTFLFIHVLKQRHFSYKFPIHIDITDEDTFSDTLDLSDMGISSRSKAAMKKKSSSSSKGSKLTKTRSVSKSGGQEDNMAAIGGRDTSIFLFRALGKILYCKSK